MATIHSTENSEDLILAVQAISFEEGFELLGIASFHGSEAGDCIDWEEFFDVETESGS